MLAFRLLLLAVVVMLASCGDAESPEQQVQKVIEQIDAAVESGDTGKLTQLLSAEYRDATGMSREEAIRTARGYFIANQWVGVMPMIAQIEFPLPDEARVRGHVVTMTGNAEVAARKWDQSAGSYELKLTLRQEDGEWKVSFAQWRRQ